MRKIIMAAMLLSSTSVIFAQKELSAFGKIDKADLLPLNANLVPIPKSII